MPPEYEHTPGYFASDFGLGIRQVYMSAVLAGQFLLPIDVHIRYTVCMRSSLLCP